MADDESAWVFGRAPTAEEWFGMPGPVPTARQWHALYTQMQTNDAIGSAMSVDPDVDVIAAYRTRVLVHPRIASNVYDDPTAVFVLVGTYDPVRHSCGMGGGFIIQQAIGLQRVYVQGSYVKGAPRVYTKNFSRDWSVECSTEEEARGLHAQLMMWLRKNNVYCESTAAPGPNSPQKRDREKNGGDTSKRQK